MREPSSSTTSTPKPGILVLEDEALVARDIQSRLQQLGFHVAGVAHTPEQALEIAKNNRLGLLLCDIHLKSDIDGVEVASRIIAEQDVPVVFLTAYSDRETVARAKGVAPSGYVLKPVETPDLQIAVEMALHKFSIEQQLRQTRELLATAMHCIGDALVFLNNSGVITNLNPEASALLHCDALQAQGKPWTEMLQLSDEHGEAAVGSFLQQALRTRAVTRLSPFTIQKVDGCQALLDGIVGPIQGEADDGGAVLMLRELVEIRDPMPSLPHPDDLPQGIDALWNCGDGENGFALLLINPDHFEDVNEQYGRASGDTVIREIGAHLNKSMRRTDLATHYGGAVFSASLPFTSLEDGGSIAEAIACDLRQHRFFNARVQLNFSIGVAHYQPDSSRPAQSPLELFRRANSALNAAKHAGGDTVAIWRPHTDIELVGNHDRQSGMFSADAGRDYRNMVLLWNTMHLVNRKLDYREIAQDLCSHFHRSLELEQVGLLAEIDGQLQLMGCFPEPKSVAEPNYGLTPNQARWVTAVARGSTPGGALNEDSQDVHCLPLRLRGRAAGALFVTAPSEGLKERDLEFLHGLMDYLAAPLLQNLPEEKASRPGASVSGGEILYQSDVMEDVLEQAGMVAPTDATVLITGESGTGKEMLARRIHSLSGRAAKPFIIVDCGAVVPSLLESELFGHTRGAFTGADKAAPGKLMQANGGTILLDEIGELPIDVQANLLRVVQDKAFSPVGSTRLQQIDARIIAATNVDLRGGVEAGSFRKDLFYRLNVFTIHAPPLRKRGPDILLLAEHFLKDCAAQYDRSIAGFTSGAVVALQRYHWPGNVRELKNVLIRAVILSRDGWIDESRLELPRLRPVPASVTQLHTALPGATRKTAGAKFPQALDKAMAEIVQQCLSDGIYPPLGDWLEEDLIRASLALHNEVGLQAAEALGLPESTLRRKVRRYQRQKTAEPPPRVMGWESICRLLPAWIEYSQQEFLDPIAESRKILLQHISQQSCNQAEAATLAGVSTPTYRKELVQLRPW
jgi:diguanylate cyclase (GGDEF)-like protein